MIKVDGMTNISDLPMQDAKKYTQLDYEQVMTLYDYHPWNKGLNPNIDQITHKILGLKPKHDNKPTRRYSLELFTTAIRDSIIPLITTNNNICCVVPSHTAGDVSLGLRELMGRLKGDLKYTNTHTHLRRIYDVEKSATGGNRSLQHNLDSIRVMEPEKIRGNTIFLLDDITSTGSSLLACKQLLLQAGASKVVMIAIGQTR